MVPKTSRMLSLDVFRGMTIAGMILVNDPGSWSSVYAPLDHSEWNGVTPTDLVFPFFIFIMGISMYISYKKYDFKFSKNTFIRLFRRSGLLFLIGLALAWFGLFCSRLNGLHGQNIPLLERILQAANNFENIRILGVLQRLALVSFFGTLIVLLVKPKRIAWIIGLILIIYWMIINATNSYGPDTNSIVVAIDRAVLGESHMYSMHFSNGSMMIFDPEGILSTLPCIAHVLLGFLAGRLIYETKNNTEKIEKLLIFGTVILFLGFLLDYGFPINKKIWSSSYVLTTCGLASLLLGLLIRIIDMKGRKRWSVFFESFGVNPIFIYVIGTILGILAVCTSFNYYGEWISLKGFVYTQWLQPVFGDYPGSLMYALMFVLICWFIGHILYRKKIYIKL